MNCFSVEYELQVMTEKLYKAFTSKISDHAVAIGIWTLKTGVKCTKITFSNEKFQKIPKRHSPLSRSYTHHWKDTTLQVPPPRGSSRCHAP